MQHIIAKKEIKGLAQNYFTQKNCIYLLSVTINIKTIYCNYNYGKSVEYGLHSQMPNMTAVNSWIYFIFLRVKSLIAANKPMKHIVWPYFFWVKLKYSNHDLTFMDPLQQPQSSGSIIILIILLENKASCQVPYLHFHWPNISKHQKLL